MSHFPGDDVNRLKVKRETESSKKFEEPEDYSSEENRKCVDKSVPMGIVHEIMPYR